MPIYVCLYVCCTKAFLTLHANKELDWISFVLAILRQCDRVAQQTTYGKEKLISLMVSGYYRPL